MNAPIISRQTAYSGEIGRAREAFCVDFIQRKKSAVERLHQRQLESIKSRQEEITCGRGCLSCCLAYMQASVAECEAIAYYLYHNGQALGTFLSNYPAWRAKLSSNGDKFVRCGTLWLKKSQHGSGRKLAEALRKAENEYRRQGLLCPFIAEGACVIYEVRPFTCAGLVATTPPEHCSPHSRAKAKTYVFSSPEMFEDNFYFGKIHGTVLAFMPLLVYSILEGGYQSLANIPGLEGLEQHHRDP